MSPTIGRIVVYRSRTGDYDVPAIINCTVDTINPKGVEAGHVPDLAGRNHVHLTVLTPGKPADYELPEGATSRNVAGCYQEWDIPLNGGADHGDGVAAGTWRWPERVAAPAEPASTPDDDSHVLIVFKPFDAQVPGDPADLGEIVGVCRTREAAEKLRDENERTEIHEYAYVEDSPLFS